MMNTYTVQRKGARKGSKWRNVPTLRGVNKRALEKSAQSMRDFSKAMGTKDQIRVVPLPATVRKSDPKKQNPQRKTMSLLAQNPSHDILVQIMRNGRWHDVDGYSGEEGAKAIAHVLARAGFTARVIRK